MRCNMLKLNTDQTVVHVILFTPKHSCEITAETTSVKIGDSEIKQTSCVRFLGTWLESKMSMNQHVNSICRSGFVQLQQKGHIRKYLTADAIKSLVNSLVTLCLNYCNAFYLDYSKTH